ncbi:hypothetical protein [uncultured Pelagimonas sp.]|uniref:hypothetical protein n=1 Tax=uncultured Pelagimonas sp. TaxID=1618102 RepID=UPI00261F354B|nr:hypothetical protein [uncultured Pelagimonas sp.]
MSADDIDRSKPPASWEHLAIKSGYTFYGRDKSKRATVLLRCHTCSELMSVHTHVLRTARAECTSCWLNALSSEAESAGLTLIGPDLTDSHRAHYLGVCGHTLNRQRGFIQRVGRGEVSLRCTDCLRERYAEMAENQGWSLLGKAINGKPNYRLFRHTCGFEQDVAICNLQSGRFTCNACAGNWASDPSAVYLFQFDFLDERTRLLKVGMSRNPASRLRHQLGLKDEVRAQILRVVTVASGKKALKAEKRLHGILRAVCPEFVVPNYELNWISVVSEIYRIEALPLISELLSDLEETLRSEQNPLPPKTNCASSRGLMQ